MAVTALTALTAARNHLEAMGRAREPTRSATRDGPQLRATLLTIAIGFRRTA